jgi:ADP-ribose pyrophosphatase
MSRPDQQDRFDDAALTETPLSSETVFHGRLLHVQLDNARLPSGNESTREFVVHPGATAVVPVLPNGNLLLERQFRYPLKRVFIELPAGKIDAGEDPLVTGQRELLEETGYSASEWIYLASMHPCIGYSNEIIHIYLARGLQAGEHHRDDDEALQLFEGSLADCLAMVQRGEITDGKTMIALMWAEKYLQGQWKPKGE